MLKRVGVLALILSAGAVFLQPTVAFAEDRSHHSAYDVDRRDNSRAAREYREPVRRDDRDRDWGGDRARINRGYYVAPPNYYYAPAPNYYYAPAPNCGYRY
jgi:hypothetical protein